MHRIKLSPSSPTPFGDIISGSFRELGKILFRPFNLKKWIILTFVAMLAGQLSFYGSFSVNLPDILQKRNLTKTLTCYKLIDWPLTLKKAIAKEDITAEISFKDIVQKAKKALGDLRNRLSGGAIKLTAVIASLVIFLILIIMWLNARFKFIFIEDIVRNDASIRKPFRDNRRQANNYFVFNIILYILYLGFIITLIFKGYVALKKIGVFLQNTDVGLGQALGTILPELISLFLFIILAIFLKIIVLDFVLPIMYKDKVNILWALGRTLVVLFKNFGYFILYLFSKIAFLIIALMIIFMVTFAFSLIFVSVSLVSGLIINGIYSISLNPWLLFFTFLSIIIGVAVSLAFWFFLNCLLLPVPVFFRIFSLKFLAGISPAYNLFSADYV